MANSSATGTSVKGYQTLLQVPNTYRRFFVDIPAASYTNPQLKGEVILSYAGLASDPVRDVYETRRIWGNGVVIILNRLVTGSTGRLFEVAVQWRYAGLVWSCYADDTLPP